MSADRFGASEHYKQQEKGYRERALKLFPWICGRCAREFQYSGLSELTVHHIDHDHTNNPNDGTNWELLCIYCHDNEHDKYTKQEEYPTEIKAGDNNQEMATYNPFADLKAMLKR
ncbi:MULTISPECIES: YajD family HNH nuclease [unclassified Pseudoalteromonas]|uniref:YajD family HNH nuclease n=1 Tax=unclassified Pseudoalteromonas TaxID=194690 RepID=UPI0005A993AA|nr:MULTISPECIES: YajD family HNH nuclease [unclassified Pseudoalteromonas]